MQSILTTMTKMTIMTTMTIMVTMAIMATMTAMTKLMKMMTLFVIPGALPPPLRDPGSPIRTFLPEKIIQV